MPDVSAWPRYWRCWRGLPPGDRPLFAALQLLLPPLATAVRVFGLGRVRRALGHGAPRDPVPGPADLNEGTRLGRLVNLAANHALGRPACLPRSLMLWWLLRRRGIESDLRIGVRTSDGRLEAHAWVECDGRVLNDAADVAARFAPFESMKLPASWSPS
jgi:hypothetical protein